MLGTPAADVALEAERPIVVGATTASVLSPRLFWAALTIAVVVLIGLIARLLQKDSA